MTDGISTYLADQWLGMLAGSAPTVPSAVYMQLHTAAPGSAGTANVSSVTTRELVGLGSPSGGSITLSGTPAWPGWSGTNGEVLTDISLWDAASGGNFLLSGVLTTPQTMYTGAPLDLTSLSIALPTAS